MYIPSFPTYLSVYILTKSEFILRPAVSSNIVQITCSTLFVTFFFKWPPVAILDVQKSLLAISDPYHNFYFAKFFTKWLLAAILDVQHSHLMGFLAISDQYKTFCFEKFYKMATGAHFGCPKFTFARISGHFRLICNFKFLIIFLQNGQQAHFGCPKFTFDRISGHFRSIRNFFFFYNFWHNGCRRPFWMSENHFNIGFFFFNFLQNGRRRPFWMPEIHFWSHFWPFQIDTQLNFCWQFFTKWLPSAILDVRNSLSIAFLAIFDQY